jgi:hypothetical protein
MWLITEYRPATLFSFKIGIATSTGAKTLFLPTPFAIRTALLDAAIRTRGKEAAEEVFGVLKPLKIAASPPERVVVTNLFTKVQKPKRGDERKGEADEKDEEAGRSAMTKSIAFREYAHLDGNLTLAFQGSDQALEVVDGLAPQINYFGKRGSFFQWMNRVRYESELPAVFTRLDEGMAFEIGKITNGAPAAFPLGVIQLMDDWGETLTFEKVNVYSDAKITIPKDRVQRNIVYSYRLTRSSRGFSYYEWQAI